MSEVITRLERAENDLSQFRRAAAIIVLLSPLIFFDRFRACHRWNTCSLALRPRNIVPCENLRRGRHDHSH